MNMLNSSTTTTTHKPSVAGALSIPVTLGLILANVLVYVVMVAGGVHWFKPENEDLIRWGGNVAPLTMYGEVWRLLSSMFLHGGLMHLLMNMYMLLLMGTLLERRFGSLRVVAVYFTTGVMGAIASAWWNSVHTVSGVSFTGFGMPISTSGLRLLVSVGASGAIMGLAGAMLVATLRPHADDTHADLKPMTKGLFQVVGLNIVLGLVISGIDQAAHVGGALAGCISGALLLAAEAPRAPWARWSGLVLVGAAGLAGFVGVSYLPHSPALDELHEALAAESRQLQLQKESALRDQEVERMAEADARMAPPPVDEAKAKGQQISLARKDDQSVTSFRFSGDGKRLYLPDIQGNRLLEMSVDQPASVRLIDGPSLPADHGGCSHNMCRGRGATSVAIASDGRFAYVTSLQQDALALVDLSTGKLDAAVPVGRFPRDVALSPDGKRAFVMNAVDNTVSVVDLQSRSVTGSPLRLQGGDASGQPFGRRVGLWVDKAHERLYVFDGVAGQVETFSVQTLQRESTLTIPDFGVEIAALSSNGQALLLIGGGRVNVLDTKAHAVQTEAVACERFDSGVIALSPDGTLLATAVGGTLRIAKLQTRRTVAAFPNVPQTQKMEFAPDGRHLYVLSSPNVLTVLDITQSLDVKQVVADQGEVLCKPAGS